MTESNPQVRRATVEDVPTLVALWRQEGLPWEELARRFQEFQVVEQPGGELVGAIGFQIAGQEGRLHSEASVRPEEAQRVRDLIWERSQVVAKNHGLVRVWTQFSAPFWHQNGFQHPAPEKLERLPAVFASSAGPEPWLCIQLREEAGPPISIEKEFAMFKEMEQERTQRLFQQARVMKLVAAVVVMIVFVLVLFWVFLWIKTRGLQGR